MSPEAPRAYLTGALNVLPDHPAPGHTMGDARGSGPQDSVRSSAASHYWRGESGSQEPSRSSGGSTHDRDVASPIVSSATSD